MAFGIAAAASVNYTHSLPCQTRFLHHTAIWICLWNFLFLTSSGTERVRGGLATVLTMRVFLTGHACWRSSGQATMPMDYVITPLSEDNYAGFAQAMGYASGAQMTFPCDFYDRSYVQALQGQLLSRVEDYPWVDCSCSSRGCCSGSEKKKTGTDLQPYNLDFQLHTNYAFDAIFAKQNRRSITLNRIPGRGDGTNYDDAPLNGICSGFGGCLRGSLGAHRYPAAWTGDIGDDPSHLVNSISLFPAACAGYLWCAYSVDLGPYSDSLAPDHPINSARYIRYMQWGAFVIDVSPPRRWKCRYSHLDISR